MAQNSIEFDFAKLSDKEKKVYLEMTDREREAYRKAWVNVETQREKLKAKSAKIRKLESAHNERARKERTHHLIEVGAVVEKSVHINNLERWKEYIQKYSHAIEKFCNDEPEKPSDSILPEPILEPEKEILSETGSDYRYYNPTY